MDKITIESEVAEIGQKPVIQQYSLDRVYSKILGGNEQLIDVYQAENFFGQSVTLGCITTNIGKEEEMSAVETCVKATICSETDTFDPEHGVDIVVGRLIRAEEEDFNTMIAARKGSEVRSLADLSVQNAASRLANYILQRDGILGSIDLRIRAAHNRLEEQFSEFK